MNVVTILTLVAILGMVVLAAYKKKAKSAEAVQSLGVLAKAAAQYFDRSDPPQPAARFFPPPSTASVPASMESVRGKRYRSAAADWTGSPWRELGFVLDEPQFYAYAFSSEGTGARAHAKVTAKGDLDGDGIESMFALTIATDESLQAKIATTLEKTNAEE